MSTITKVTLARHTWQFTVPEVDFEASFQPTLNLLTTMGISICGQWQGELGQHFVAWRVTNESVTFVPYCGQLH